ncbi:MAG: GntR family transcriptional regulator [Chloroflexi bacterium]|nr:GntR family transcriptional regulator [Chloroflexota bacterium]
MNSNRDFAPLYYQIKQHLLEQLNDGKLKPGDLLPSEAQLSAKYNVSRITVRRALKELIQQGLLYSLQGKGTFAAHAFIREMSGFRSFSQDIQSKGLHPSSQVVRSEQMPSDEDVAAHLKINAGEPVHLLQRIRLADDQPVAFETAYLPVSLFPDLYRFDLSQSLYQILSEKYQVHPAWADAEIQSTTASPDVAQALRMRTGEPVLIAHRLSYTESFDVVEYVVSVYCGSRFTFYTGRQSIA